MKLHNKTYDVVIPFGHTCAAAMYASEWCFRTCSLPLDWAGTGLIGIKATAEFVINGFDDFLVPERLKPWKAFGFVPPDAAHDYYIDTKTDLVFIHDFRKGIPLSEEGPVVLERYNRRIKRMMQMMEAPTKKLIFCWSHDEDPSAETLIEVAEMLRKRFPQGEIDLLFFANVKNMKGVETTSIAPGITLCHGYFHDSKFSVTMGDCRVTNRILKHVSLRGRRRAVLKRAIGRLLFKLRAAIELNPEKRREYRKQVRDKTWGN